MSTEVELSELKWGRVEDEWVPWRMLWDLAMHRLRDPEVESLHEALGVAAKELMELVGEVKRDRLVLATDTRSGVDRADAVKTYKEHLSVHALFDGGDRIMLAVDRQKVP